MKLQLLLFLISHSLLAQNHSITGQFSKQNKQTITLKRYELFTEQDLATTITDDSGNFSMDYTTTYKGAAMLYVNNSPKILLLLNGESINLQWQDLNDYDGLLINNSSENNTFKSAMELHQNANAKLAGLDYLVPLYSKDSITQAFFIKELKASAKHYSNYIKQLDNKLYAKKYLQWRGLVSNMPQSVKQYHWRIQQHEQDFNSIDFADTDLIHSGVFKSLLEGYTQLCKFYEAAAVYKHLNPGITHVIESLNTTPDIQQEVSEYWFKYLEKHSLFKASEHLALQMLDNNKCQLSDNSTKLFEQYRKMAVGKTAPDISLTGTKKLSEIKNTYKLVFFGASWCPSCQTEYVQLKEHYASLKAVNNIEVVYVSIDTDKEAFTSYYKEAPFITYCDTKGWETQAAIDYYVSATPTLFLLDKDLKIILKPNNIAHLKTWLENN